MIFLKQRIMGDDAFISLFSSKGKTFLYPKDPIRSADVWCEFLSVGIFSKIGNEKSNFIDKFFEYLKTRNKKFSQLSLNYRKDVSSDFVNQGKNYYFYARYSC